MSKRILIVHNRDGIYIGHALGMGFFSKLDPVDQPAATTFEDKDDAREHISEWVGFKSGDVKMDEFTFVEVEPDRGEFISSEAVANYGLEPWPYAKVEC